MNRQQRRAAAKQGVTHKDLREITEHSIASGMQEGKKQAINTAVECYSVAIAYVMHYKMGYGEKKCITTLNQIAETFHNLHDDTLNLANIKKQLEQDIHVQFSNN
jgi:hypothetical protein